MIAMAAAARRHRSACDRCPVDDSETRGKELLTTKFRCFANYPRLTPILSLRYPSSSRNPETVVSTSWLEPDRQLVHLLCAHHCIAPRHEKRSLVKDLSRTSIHFQDTIDQRAETGDSHLPIQHRRASDLPRRTRMAINESAH